ncbi:hypothetical protein AAG906_010521 [Vitis piasezkii]
MAGRTRGGRSERNEELETVREELREVRRELRETVELMRGQVPRRAGGTCGHEDSGHSHRRSRERPRMSQMEAMKRFMVMQPPSFNGEPRSSNEHWLRRMRRIRGPDIPKERRVGKYFGEVAKHAKRMEFEHLIQGTMSEYESLLELSRFALGMIGEEGEKARRCPHSMRGGGDCSRAAANRVCYGCGAETIYGGLAHCEAHSKFDFVSGSFQSNLPYYQMPQLPQQVGTGDTTMSSRPFFSRVEC